MTLLSLSNTIGARGFSVKTFVPKALAAIFLASLLPIYWIAYHAPAVGIYHDDGIYLVTAKALAEGKGYRIVSLPEELPQTKYPVLFPAVMSVAWKLSPGFPENALYLKAIPFLSAMLWMWMTYRLIKEETGAPGIALWIVLLTAASSWVVFFSTTCMSETFFAFLVAWALIRLKRLEGQRGEGEIGWPLLLSTILVAATYLTRTVGVSLVAAGAISMFRKRKYIPGVMFLFGCAVLIAPWLGWQTVYADSIRAIDSYYTSSNYKSWNILWNFTVEQKFHVVLINIYRIIFSPIALLNLKQNAIGYYISIVMVLLTCSGFIRDMRKDIGSIHLFMLFYFGIITFWVWPPGRFLLPIIPYLFLFLYKELVRICDRIFKHGNIPSYISLVLAVFLGVQMMDGLLSSTRETMKRQAQALSLPSEQDDWRPVRELMDWVRQNTPEDSILLGNLDPTYHLYTGRKAVRGFSADPYRLYYTEKPETALGNDQDLIQRIAAYRVGYIVRTPSRFFMEGPIFNGILDKLTSEFPEALRLVKVGSEPSCKIYEVDQGKLHDVLRTGDLNARDGHGAGPVTGPGRR